MKKKLQSKSLLVTASVGGSALAFLMLLFLPRMRQIAEIHQQLHGKQDYIAQAEKLPPIIQQVERELAETKAYIARWQPKAVRPDQLPLLFGQISQLAKTHGATTTRFEPLPAVQWATVQKVPVTFGVSAPLDSIEKLLLGLESLPASLWAEDLKLSAARQNSETEKCDLVLGIFVDNPKKSD